MEQQVASTQTSGTQTSSTGTSGTQTSSTGTSSTASSAQASSTGTSGAQASSPETSSAQTSSTEASSPETSSAQTHWLDDEEQYAWREYLRTNRLLEVALDHELQAHGLQLSEYEIISILSEQPGRRLRMSVIAELVVQSRSRLTHTAGRLERRQWVRREACSGDRRGVELVLTDAGYEEIRRMAPTHVASVRANFLDHLSRADLISLGQSMAAISSGIKRTGICDEVRADEVRAEQDRPI